MEPLMLCMPKPFALYQNDKYTSTPWTYWEKSITFSFTHQANGLRHSLGRGDTVWFWLRFELAKDRRRRGREMDGGNVGKKMGIVMEK